MNDKTDTREFPAEKSLPVLSEPDKTDVKCEEPVSDTKDFSTEKRPAKT